MESKLNNYIDEAYIQCQKSAFSAGCSFLPSKELFSSIVESAFYVSLMCEESRFSSFRIGIGDSSSFDVFELRERKQFSYAELRKLVPVANPSISIICVELIDDELYISRIVAHKSNLTEMATGAAFSGSSLPKLFNVFAKGIGRIACCFGDREVLEFYSGNTLKMKDGTFILDKLFTSFGSEAEEAMKKVMGTGYNNSSININSFFFPVFQVLNKIEQLKHGGTLLIVPHIEDVIDQLDIKYRVDNNYLCSKEIELMSRIHEMKAFDATLEDISCYSDMVGCFSAVDGAVVMNSMLEVIGFGAEILTEKAKIKSVDVINGRGEIKSVRIDLFGTRHRSAFRFCKKNPNAVAFIISQDGGIKYVMNNGYRVKVYTDLNIRLI